MTTKITYIDHSLTFDAEPICGAALTCPPEGDVEYQECPDCEAAISSTLDLLAKLAP